jgi:hypothetical protein
MREGWHSIGESGSVLVENGAFKWGWCGSSIKCCVEETAAVFGFPLVKALAFCAKGGAGPIVGAVCLRFATDALLYRAVVAGSGAMLASTLATYIGGGPAFGGLMPKDLALQASCGLLFEFSEDNPGILKLPALRDEVVSNLLRAELKLDHGLALSGFATGDGLDPGGG